MKKINKKAFTLAETLITLMVIGVVAALTIPSLMQTYKDIQLKTATKKAMTTISNGFKLMIANNDGTTDSLPLTQCGDDFSCLSNVFHKFFQIGMDKSKSHEGLVEKYTKHDSDEEAGFVWDDVPYIFTTNDGMTYGYLANGFDVVVDLNGNKTPNKICKDVIKLSFSGTTIKDSELKDEVKTSLCANLDNKIASSGGSGVTAWASKPCTEESKGCYVLHDGGEPYTDIYDDSGKRIISISDESGGLCTSTSKEFDSYCKEFGYTHCEDRDGGDFSACYK